MRICAPVRSGVLLRTHLEWILAEREEYIGPLKETRSRRYEDDNDDDGRRGRRAISLSAIAADSAGFAEKSDARG